MKADLHKHCHPVKEPAEKYTEPFSLREIDVVAAESRVRAIKRQYRDTPDAEKPQRSLLPHVVTLRKHCSYNMPSMPERSEVTKTFIKASILSDRVVTPGSLQAGHSSSQLLLVWFCSQGSDTMKVKCSSQLMTIWWLNECMPCWGPAATWTLQGQ
jgi:hypothetical protein